jgi:hypothetical protein
VVEESLFEDLLVQTGAIEAGVEGELDIADEGLIRWGGEDAVGVIALIEDEALEDRFAVDQD